MSPELPEECPYLQSDLKNSEIPIRSIPMTKQMTKEGSADNEGMKKWMELKISQKNLNTEIILLKKGIKKMVYHHFTHNGLLTAFPNVEISLTMFFSFMESNTSVKIYFLK